VTREDAVDALRSWRDSDDREAAHYTADRILLAVLKELGADDVVEAYNALRDEVGFWYA
jgi:hypothetical protein